MTPNRASISAVGFFLIALLVSLFLYGCDDFFVDTSNCTSITVTAPSQSMLVAQSQQFSATCAISGGGSNSVTNSATWSSSSPSVATVSTTGLVIGVSPGSTSISATDVGISGSVSLTVNSPALLSIAVTAPANTVTHGSTLPLTATGTFADNHTQDISSVVTWKSDNTAVATVSSTGVVTGVTAGSANITASLGSVTSPVFTVTVQ